MDDIQISPDKLHNYEEKVGGPILTFHTKLSSHTPMLSLQTSHLVQTISLY